MATQAQLLEEQLFDFHSPQNTGKEEPVFENHPTLLRNYWPRIRDKLAVYAEKVYGIKPRFGEWRMRVSELPTYRALGRNLGRILGKVFGRYTPGEKRIEFDASVFPELNHPTRYDLRRQGMLAQDAEEVGIHEGGHAIQEESGALERYAGRAWFLARHYIEGLNTKFTEYATGRKQVVYRGAQRLAEYLIRRHGTRKAFLGNVPQEELLPIAIQPRPAYAFVKFRYAR